MGEIWGDTAIYTDLSEARGLAKIIDTLMSDAGKRQELAGKARERALSRYTAERMADEYSRLYLYLVHKYQKSHYKLPA